MSFLWSSKNELTLAEKLAVTTKKTREDLAAKINLVTESAKKVSVTTLTTYAASHTDTTCVLNFSDEKFTIGITSFGQLKADMQLQVIDNVAAYLKSKENGFDVTQELNVLTVKWVMPVPPVVPATVVPTGTAQEPVVPSTETEKK
jgi:hypothetical protein